MTTDDRSDRSLAVERLRAAAFFRALSPRVLEALGKAAEVFDFDAGTTLAEGVSTNLWMVLEGQVGVVSGTGELAESLMTLGPGSVFGKGPVTGRPEHAPIVAQSRVQVLGWPQDVLQRLFIAYTELQVTLATQLSLYGRTRALVAQLRQTAMFRDVSPALIRELLSEATLRRVAKEETIFEAGDSGDALFLIVQGQVRIEKPPVGKAKRPSEVAFLHAGDAFGEMALLFDEPRNASAIAIEDSELLEIQRDAFEALCRCSAPFHRDVLLLSHARRGRNQKLARSTRAITLVNRSRVESVALGKLLAAAMAEPFDETTLVCVVGEGETRAPRRVDGASASGSVYLAACSPERWRANARSWCKERHYHHALRIAAHDAPSIEARLLDDDCAAVFITETPGQAFPHHLAPLQSLTYGLSLTPADREKPLKVRRGSLRLFLDAPAIAAADSLADVPSACRLSIERLGRAVTRRAVGLALSGGGAWGFSHHALLRSLERVGVPVDGVSGSSFGGLAGAFYAAEGKEGLRLLERNVGLLDKALLVCPLSTWPIKLFVERLLGQRYLESTPIPVFPIAADILDGREKVFRHGLLSDSVRASGSFPGVFGPAIMDGHRYVDGAIVNNVPTSILPEEGMDFIVASDVMQLPPALTQERGGALGAKLSQLYWPWRMRDFIRSMLVALQAGGQAQASVAHATFRPKLPDYLPTDMAKMDGVLALAEEQVEPFVRDVKARYESFCQLGA